MTSVWGDPLPLLCEEPLHVRKMVQRASQKPFLAFHGANPNQALNCPGIDNCRLLNDSMIEGSSEGVNENIHASWYHRLERKISKQPQIILEARRLDGMNDDLRK